MRQHLHDNGLSLSWIGRRPGNKKNKALLIPQFNEYGAGFESRLKYIDSIACRFSRELDVILIDDGSTDNSVAEVMRYHKEHNAEFYVAAVYPNAKKVGALFMTVLEISHDIIILSDFDTQILDIEKLWCEHNDLLNHDEFMGCYFRMLAFEGSGRIFRFQQLEYSMERSLYKLHEKENTIRVMPGAGSCYKRDILLSIYRQHSGLRSGEDREATIIGLKLGYKTFYLNDVLALTKPPLSFRGLVKQRIRWNLGYIETLYKEARYYRSEVAKMSMVGKITMTEVLLVMFTVLLPVLIILLAILDYRKLFLFLGLVYLAAIIGCISLLRLSPTEYKELKHKKAAAVLFFPFIKIALDCYAWTGAIISFIKRGPVFGKGKKNVSKKIIQTVNVKS
jgi:cellulose synthase/poly-beta-1,6-N-acetylglucosamine synthase-like glycosyltransferase